MTDDKTKYETVRDRVNTRESSTLVVATVASSAALVLLTAFDSSQFHCYALAFAFLGILYRELTIFSSDRLDYIFLRGKTNYHPSASDIESRRERVRPLDKFARLSRAFIVRSLLALPIIIFFFPFLWVVVIVVIIGFLVYLEYRMISDC